ncbi:MAG: hypothetical protein ACLFPQ_00915 [Candidatus Woesearchaeota archaeon]
MVSIKTYSFRDKAGTERGVFYLSETDHDEEKREWELLENLRVLRSEFANRKQKVFDHAGFLVKFEKELSSYLDSSAHVLRGLEKSKRFAEENEVRIIGEIKSLVIELQNLLQKTIDDDVKDLVENTCRRLEYILDKERSELKVIRSEQRRLSHKRKPKKCLQIKLSSKKNDDLVSGIMKDQGHDLKSYEAQSSLYPVVRKHILKLLQFSEYSGFYEPHEKKTVLGKLDSELKELLVSYQASFVNEFRVDVKVDFDEFCKMNYIKEVSVFVEHVKSYYGSLIEGLSDDEKKNLKHYNEIKKMLSFLKRCSAALNKHMSEIIYWAQQDFVDDKFILNKDMMLIKRLNDSLKNMHNYVRGKYRLVCDKLDSYVPCYHLKLYEEIKTPEGGWEEGLSTNVLIGSCPDVLQKIAVNQSKIDDHVGLDRITPAQIYVPSIEVNELSDNVSIQFPYRLHKYYSQLGNNGSGIKIDIIGNSDDMDRLREKIFFSIYRDSETIRESSNININDEINFIKVHDEYTFKTREQIRQMDTSVGRSPLRVMQHGDSLWVYVGNKLENKLSLKITPTRDKTIKKLSKVQKKTHWMNRSKSLRCYIIDDPVMKLSSKKIYQQNKTLLDRRSSKILHYKNTNIWIDPVGKPIDSLISHKIHPDVINAVILTRIDDENSSGFGSFLQFKKKRMSRFTLLTTKELLEKILFKFSYIFDKENPGSLKEFLSPIIIKEGEEFTTYDVDEHDFVGKTIRTIDRDLKIELKQSRDKSLSYSFKFSFDNKTIGMSGSNVIRRDDYLFALDSVLEKLGFKDAGYSRLFDSDERIAQGLWSVAASLRQRSLDDSRKSFYDDFSSIAFQKLVDLNIPSDKIAYLNNQSLFEPYAQGIKEWAEREDFSWYDDCDIIFHEMGLPPEHTTPDVLLELNRFLLSNSTKNKFSIFVESCSDIKDAFPKSFSDENLIAIAKKEFEKNNIILLSDAKINKIQP